MPRWIPTLLLLLILFAVGGVPADEPTTEQLIEKLGDRNFRVREKAGKALMLRGEESLPKLRKSLDNADPEIRRRIEVLTNEIEIKVLLEPKRVTVKGKELSPKSVLESIAKQTGYKLEMQGDAKESLTYDFVDKPFWQVMHQLMNDAGLFINWDQQEDKLTLSPNDTCNPHAHVSGPFLFVAQNISYSRSITLGNVPRRNVPADNQADSLYFSFLIQSEPKTPLVSIGAARLTKALDENGQSLMPRIAPQEDPGTRYNDAGYRNFQFSAAVQLFKVNRDALKAKVIRGTIPVVILSEIRPEIEVPNVLKVKKKKFVGKTVEIMIEESEVNNGLHEIQMTIQRIGTFDPNDNSWMNNVQQKMELLDEKGGKFVSYGAGSVLNSTPTSIQAKYQFGDPTNGKIGKPAKLVFNQWLTYEHDVEFEFKDLPLP